MESLKRQRAIVKAKLTRFKTFFNNFITEDPNERNATMLQVRLKQVELLWSEFDNIQNQIDCTDGALDDSENERATFEESYFNAIVPATDFLSEMNRQLLNVSTHSTISTSSLPVSPHRKELRLPTLHLPTFNGAYDQWRLFCDSFSFIGSDHTLDGCQKMRYLKSCLAGEALQVISALEINEDNYNIAWELLKDRYHNTRIIVNTHVKAIFELLPTQKDSYTSLRYLVDGLQKHVQALQALKQPTESWNVLLVYLVTSKLDKESRKEWESLASQKHHEELPSFMELMNFLKQRCQYLEMYSSSCAIKESSSNNPKAQNHTKSHSFAINTSSCKLCNEAHLLYQCHKFHEMSVPERAILIKRLRICFNCLRQGHLIKECKSSSTCKMCNKKHHTLIHNQQHQTIKTDASTSQTEAKSNIFHESQNTTSAHLSNKTSSRNMSVVYLSTAVVRTYDVNGKEIHLRALLDSGSESSFITKEAIQLLGFKTDSINLNIKGISGSMCTSKEVIEMKIYSRINNFEASLNCFVLSKLTAYTPSMNIHISEFTIPQNLQLADPEFQIPAQIDMLIGTELFYNIISSGQISPAKNLPILQNSQFGWIVAGRYTKCNLVTKNITSCNLSLNLDEQLKRFWEIEEVCHERKFSPEEVKCEEHFRQNTTRQENGRYVVKLPFKENYEDLGDSKTMCLKRFNSLEQRLNRNDDQKIEYSKFLREYMALGHMVKVSANEETGYFLPHHSIIKKGSLSTKLRVVFDGSANSNSGLSLNDVLMVGPTIQDDLFSIVIRFRLHKYVFTADIEKMYRQILVNDNDSNYQKILWRENNDQPIETYKLRTVTYGTGPAPFLAVRCIHQLVVDEGAQFKLAPAKIMKDFYVDDILTGADTLEEAALLRDELISLLSLGGFNLRKWSSNQMNLLKNLTCSDPLVALDPTKTIKTLGLHWNAHEDEILYSVNDATNSKPTTKRQILSEIAKLFDPLGLLGPIIVTAKILMQKLWQLKLHWDEPVPQNVSIMWNAYYKDLPVLCSLKIPRRIVIEASSELQLHGFCDASEVAYGACIYIRSTDKANNSLMRLVCSKSRVAPLKKISLPRLELCAAVLLSNLLNVIVKSLDVQFSRIYCWSDSTITLHWINTEPHLLKTFVANRVSEVQSLTNTSQWKHISSEENPADVISRGELPTSISANSLWWNGPSWILDDESTWPNRKIIVPKDVSNLYELKGIAIQSNITFNQCTVFGKFSSLKKLQRVMAYCHRFGRNLKCQINERNLGPLTVEELNQSLKFLIKAAQGELYSQEINDLSEKKIINKNSSLIKLQPFLDKDNILRVGGRLQNADLFFENKHQIILPQKHILTKQIIESEHKHMLHAGLQAVLYEIRKLYWPINARNLTRSIVNKCLICYRFKAKECSQIMGNLPKYRVQLSRPFVNTGVDYGGPLLIRQSSNRKSALIKSYIALFICMATKAIHLELVTGLSTEHFLAALRRFIARRGKCAHIFSDNGTNFQGAHHELQDLHAFFNKQSNSDNIINAAAAEQIQWHFIPPRSPHFGGLWEAGIKSVKYHLKRVIGESHLTFEELYTTLVQIESCVNSRPLTPLYDNPNDFSILTPGHFLIGDSLTQPAEPDLVQIPINKLSRWQLTKQLQQHFWKRWSSDYLNSLQQRGKWTMETENLKIGCLVLVKDDNIPPLQWKLARITALHPGTDKKVRVASIITSSGSYKRSITKLCVLPLDQ